MKLVVRNRGKLYRKKQTKKLSVSNRRKEQELKAWHCWEAASEDQLVAVVLRMGVVSMTSKAAMGLSAG